MSIEPRPLKVVRRPDEFTSDNTRVIARSFQPRSAKDGRTHATVNRVLDLPEDEVDLLLEDIKAEYSHRHRDFEEKLEQRFAQEIAPFVPSADSLSSERKLLLAAYFTKEYSVESAALFNPSIVPHPNQDRVPEGGMRFIMSFRATGEGHISSIVFRSGIINSDCVISFDPISRYIETPQVRKDAIYDRHLFQLKLNEMDACNEVTALLFDRLAGDFTFDKLIGEIERIEEEKRFAEEVQSRTFETMRWLACSNYELEFREDRSISERVIFPISENESNGIEDARFVRFIDDDGTVTYYATYTAFNGVQILPQLIETKDFVRFNIITFNGKAVQNKGLALFPRKINGMYVMVSRQDGVNLNIMYSDHLHFWQEARVIQRPERPWEFTQIGNCGSPVETGAGWLLLTHGVGPMREYSIGVQLLDLHDPSKVIARLDEPILAPNKYEREGYVPNVVYTCGYMTHKDQLIIPYAMSDTRCAIASLSVTELLDRLLNRAG
ncbi:glycoside hydrolase family 130 protein [Acidobacteriota bacterium]